MKKWVGRWPKREMLLWNGFREEIGLPMTDTGHREWLQKEWRTGDGENDREMISRVTMMFWKEVMSKSNIAVMA